MRGKVERGGNPPKKLLTDCRNTGNSQLLPPFDAIVTQFLNDRVHNVVMLAVETFGSGRTLALAILYGSGSISAVKLDAIDAGGHLTQGRWGEAPPVRLRLL
ncbi:hypothetical protein EBR25_10930 [bacterium]|nr:hypothetical protein [bacterium]